MQKLGPFSDLLFYFDPKKLIIIEVWRSQVYIQATCVCVCVYTHTHTHT